MLLLFCFVCFFRFFFFFQTKIGVEVYCRLRKYYVSSSLSVQKNFSLKTFFRIFLNNALIFFGKKIYIKIIQDTVTVTGCSLYDLYCEPDRNKSFFLSHKGFILYNGRAASTTARSTGGAGISLSARPLAERAPRMHWIDDRKRESVLLMQFQILCHFQVVFIPTSLNQKNTVTI